MLLHYDWPEDEIPAVGTLLDISGDPDKPVLRGQIWRHLENEEGDVEAVSIMMVDGQEGAEGFQLWVAAEGDIGVMVAAVG